MTTAYRVPRRFILPPDEPPPYGLLLVSLAGHLLLLVMSTVVSAYVSSRIDESKVYVVNLVPATPPRGSTAPRALARQAPEEPARAAAPAPSKAAPERPKTQAPEAPPPPPKPSKAEPPPRPAARTPEPPPPPPPSATTRVAKTEPPAPPRPSELALPRQVEKAPPRLDPPPPPQPVAQPPAPPRAPERSAPPAAEPASPPRVPEPPRVADSPTRPTPPPVAAPALAAARPGVDPVPLGRPDAAGTSGSLSLDVSDFPFTYYLRQIQAKISERWAPPRAAAAGAERAVILFEIDRDGQIKEPKLERESGNPLYDQSALRAIIEASPFPPLPPEFKAPSLRVHFGFEWKPDKG